MYMKNNTRLVYLIFISLLFVCCINSNVKTISGIKVSVQVLVVSSEHGFNYEKTLKSALNGNDCDLKKISTLDFFDTSVGYDHGAILVEIINEIGEDRFLIAVNDCDRREKIILKGYLRAGMEYGKYPDKALSELFPKIAVFLDVPFTE